MRLFVMPNGVCDGEDGLGLARQERMIGQLGSPRSFGQQQMKCTLVQDLAPRLAQVRVDHVADQVMCEAIAARTTCPGFLLAQDATPDGLLQCLDSYVYSLSGGQAAQFGHLPEMLGSRLSSKHSTDHYQLARGLCELGQARLDQRPHRGR